MKIAKVSQKYKDMSDDELKEYIRQKLSMDPKWVRRALTALYDEQTPEEQADPVNVHINNGMGFSPQDQEFLTSLAKQALAGNISFSQKQIGWLYQLLPKYAGQMVKIVRTLERMEPTFTHTLYYAQVLLNNNTRLMEATTGNLKLEPLSMPDTILIRSPDGNMTNLFQIHDVNVGPDGPTLFIYREIKKVDDGKKPWELQIEVQAEDHMPSLEEAIQMMSGQGSIKKPAHVVPHVPAQSTGDKKPDAKTRSSRKKQS